MNIKVDFDNIVVKEDKNDFNVKVLMLKGEKGDRGDGEPNVIETVQVNGTALPVTNKTVNVPVPTIDSTISSSSTNPVQNSTIYTALSNKVDTSELSNYYEISEVDDLLKQKPYCFDNVAEMKSYNLIEGDYAITKGYYRADDGGGANYIIVNNDLADDGGSIHELTNGLKAVLLIKNETINFRQLGAKNNSDEANFDNKNFLLNYVAICDRDQKTYKLIIPSGVWYFTPTHICRIGGVDIEGVGIIGERTFSAPTFKAISSQDYILKFGGVADMLTTTLSYDATNTNNIIKNIRFSSDYQINYGALVLEYANYGIYDELYFNNLIGTGLYIRSCWENYFKALNFRDIKDFASPCLKFGSARPISGVSANISSTTFDNLMFEIIAGDMIYSERGSEFINNQFNTINIENSYSLQDGETSSSIGSSEDTSTYTPTYMLNGNLSGCTFGTINYTGLQSSSSKVLVNSTYYYYKGLFKTHENVNSSANDKYAIVIDNIFLRKLSQILEAKNVYVNGFLFSLGQLICDENTLPSNFKLFDADNCGQININSYQSRYNKSKSGINSIDLYNYAIPGCITTSDGTFNPYGLCIKKYGTVSFLVNEINKLKYPFAYSETKRKKYSIRVKGTNNASLGFNLRGYINGTASNKQYNFTGTGDWQEIEIYMNYDLDSNVIIMNLTEGTVMDTLTYIGEENIT